MNGTNTAVPAWEQYLFDPTAPSARIDPARWNTEFVRRISLYQGALLDKKESGRLIFPVDERVSLLEKIDALGYTFVQTDIDALIHRRSDAPMFFSHSLKEIPYLILQAYLENHIDEHDASYALLRWSCESQVEEDISLNPTSSESFRYREYQLLTNNTTDISTLYLFSRHLTDMFGASSFASLIEKIKHNLQPEPYKTRFFVLHRLEDPLLTAVRDSLNECNQGPFILKDSTGIFQQIVIPPDFLNFIYFCKYGQQTIYPLPALGYSSKEKLSDFSQRVVSIPFPRNAIHYPKYIHLFEATPLSAYSHDVNYHCLVESANPDREFWTKLALTPEFSFGMKESLLDRNLPFYTYKQCPLFCFSESFEFSDRFWLSYASSVSLLDYKEEAVDALRKSFSSLWNSSMKDLYSKESLKSCLEKLQRSLDTHGYHGDLFSFHKQLDILLSVV